METFVTFVSFATFCFSAVAMSASLLVCYLTWNRRERIDSLYSPKYSQLGGTRAKKLKPRAKSDEELYRDEKDGN